MNFWMIFLCLLFGAIAGFEFGKYMESRRIREVMKSLSEGMKEAAEKMQKMAEKQKEQTDNHLRRLGVVGFDTRYYQMNEAMYAANSRALNKKEELEMCRDLIIEMTRKGALDSEIGRVVRYSMVVIDADKLRLDWVTAKRDEGIEHLKTKYMDHDGIDILKGGDTDGDDSVMNYIKEIKEAIQDGKGV